MVLNGVTLWTWRAYDIVGIAAALKADATGSTSCGMCGRAIHVLVRGGAPERSTAIGWLPDESCSNVMAEFCPSALLFCANTHLEEWRSKSGGTIGEALDLDGLATRGRVAWRELIPLSRSGAPERLAQLLRRWRSD
jgi:Alkylmercury lyase